MTDEDLLVKADESPVTTRDLAGQALYVLLLERALGIPPGELRLCGEETTDLLEGPDAAMLLNRISSLLSSEGIALDPDHIPEVIDRGSFRPEPGSASTHWICDPIDGTKRFLSGHVYSTCLALVRGGHLVAGAIGVPDLEGGSGNGSGESDAHGTLVGAFRGGGAFQVEPGDLDQGRVPLVFKCDESDDRAVRIARSLGSVPFGPSMRTLLEASGIDGIPVQVDNQSKYAALVTGQVDLILQPGGSVDLPCSWDYAPGVLIAEEFGLHVRDSSNNIFDFDTGPFLQRNRGVRCASRDLYEKIFR